MNDQYLIALLCGLPMIGFVLLFLVAGSRSKANRINAAGRPRYASWGSCTDPEFRADAIGRRTVIVTTTVDPGRMQRLPAGIRTAEVKDQGGWWEVTMQTDGSVPALDIAVAMTEYYRIRTHGDRMDGYEDARNYLEQYADACKRKRWVRDDD